MYVRHGDTTLVWITVEQLKNYFKIKLTHNIKLPVLSENNFDNSSTILSDKQWLDTNKYLTDTETKRNAATVKIIGLWAGNQ